MTKKDSSSWSDIKSLDEPETAGYAGMLDEDEDIYELSMDDIVYDEEEDELEPVAAAAIGVSAPARHDPLSTLTLAELYEQQGFVAKALDIYRTVLADDPDNAQLQAKISMLAEQASAAEILPEQPEAPEETEESAPADFEETAELAQQPPFIAAPVDITIAEPEPVTPAVFEGMSTPVEAQDFSPLVHNQADNVTGTLENWLENIRRIKACR
jgi:tetratricopeptide (TPR) repeat protein